MRFSLLTSEFKIFNKAINSLGKFGQEIYFECNSVGLILKAVNPSRTAYAAITFKIDFFDKVHYSEVECLSRFKINSRYCCDVFRSSPSFEKSVNKCKLFLSNGNTTLTILFFCKHEIVKTFEMSIIECEHLEAVFSLEETSNRVVLATKILCEVMNNFRCSEEISIGFRDGECLFQNYIFNDDISTILTQLPITAAEFDSYVVGCKCEVTFCRKQLRALLAFSEFISPVLRIYCDKPGQPIVFVCASDTRFEAHFVLATLPIEATNFLVNSQLGRSSLLAAKTQVRLQRQPAMDVNHTASRPITNVEGVSEELVLEFPIMNGTISEPQPKDANVQLLSNDETAGTDMTTLLPTAGRENLLDSVADPSELPIPSLRPFHIPQLRQSVVSPVNTAPPTKKARSTLFSHMELSNDKENMAIDDGRDIDLDPDNFPHSASFKSIEAMDMELFMLTGPGTNTKHRKFDGDSHSTTRPSSRTSSVAARTVLVADSDEEN